MVSIEKASRCRIEATEAAVHYVIVTMPSDKDQILLTLQCRGTDACTSTTWLHYVTGNRIQSEIGFEGTRTNKGS